MAGIQLHSKDWAIQPAGATRGAVRGAEVALQGLPSEFLAAESSVAEEFVAAPTARATRGGAAPPSALDFSYDAGPQHTAVLAIRQPSGALTFHLPAESTSRSGGQSNAIRFVVNVQPSAAAPRTRSVFTQAVKAIVIKVAKVAADKAISDLLPVLAAKVEGLAWGDRPRGWVRVSRDGLAGGTLVPAAPTSSERTLLLLHGTFSHAAAAFKELASSAFFDRVAPLYGDRIFAFNHFTVSETPEDNARRLLEALPASTRCTFDVVAHSRGALVLRNLVERRSEFQKMARRFTAGRSVLVASPNEGTPLATPRRWEETLGFVANLLEMLPENPFTTGPAFVANGLVWLAQHASGDLPGLRSMDADGDLIADLQEPPGPPSDAYAALVSNYHPTGARLARLVDAGLDQFFGMANDLVVPSAGGWQIDRAATRFIPATRIGCFGPGGNLPSGDVTHIDFFKQRETIDFLVAALSGQALSLKPLDPAQSLPDRRLTRTVGAAVGVRRGRVTRDGGMSDRPAAAVAEEAAPALRISILNGDLTFEERPMLLGHYRSTRLTGTEKVMDALTEGAMRQSLDLGVYPLLPGTHQVFVNSLKDPESARNTPRPEAVIVVGLGEEGKLRSSDLAHTIRQAVIAWSQRLAQMPRRKAGAPFVLATTLVGSGGTGVTAGQAAQGIAQGAFEANELLRASQAERKWPLLEDLRIVELYLDRATDAWRALRMQEDVSPDRFTVAPVVREGAGALLRALDSGYRGADYDFITAVTQPLPNGESQIAYTLDTKRARTEIRAQQTQGRLLRDLVATASNDRNTDSQIGRTLFKLLVPVEMEPFLAGASEMQIELDSGTAGIPWELLDTDLEHNRDARRPWALRSKLLRKLRTEEFRAQVTDASAESSVLIVGEPECPTEYPRLSGARVEARAVRECLATPGGLSEDRVRDLISPDDGVGPDARTVINALLERDWRIVHLAGHGALPSELTGPGGVVLSNGTFLGPREIRTMRAVPELVFVNCCHLAARDIDQLLRPDAPFVPSTFDRARFAAGVAEELIRIGVRCVIAAGWAVDDGAAMAFARTFYESLLRGVRFIDAVAEARSAAYDEGGNTWAAYQCYGDPDWVFRRDPADAQQPTTAVVDEFAGIASSSSLRLALDTIVVQTKFQKRKPAKQLERVRVLEDRFAKEWGSMGRVAEAFGHAYAAARDVDTAISWYVRALAANDGTASIKSAEQLGNLRVRRAWEEVVKAQEAVAAAKADKGAASAKPKGKQPRGKAKASVDRGRKEAERHLAEALASARTVINETVELLETVVRLQPTVERESLYGSAMKRLALLEAAAGRPKEERKAIERMKEHYQRAYEIGEKGALEDAFYPALNYLAADAMLNAGSSHWKGYDADVLDLTKRSLEASAARQPEFWSLVGQTELILYRSLATKRLKEALSDLDEGFQDVGRRVTAPWMWASVYDNARFVLSKYTARLASPAERKAADALLERLKGLATARSVS